MAYDAAADYVFSLYSETDMLGTLGEHAHRCMVRGDRDGALVALNDMQVRFGDMLGLRMRMDDAIRALDSKEPR